MAIKNCSSGTMCWCYSGILICLAALCYVASGNQTSTSLQTQSLTEQQQKQVEVLWKAREECYTRISNVPKPADGGPYCPPLFDDIVCWSEYVSAGTTVYKPCPSYLVGFFPTKYAERKCMEDGTWATHPHPEKNNTYTEFGECTIAPLPKHKRHMSNVIKIATVGYSISLAALVIASVIMISFKKLHCQRNTIHLNLFASFMLRAASCLLRNILLVDNVALPSDITYTKDGTLTFKEEGLHWECKLLTSVWIYTLLANYFWIFVEGLYLHTLIFFDVFSQSKRFFKIYFIIGWVCPLFLIIAWVIYRIFKNNKVCWNTHLHEFWIIDAPIILTICVNFFFFLNIVRVLFTKIRDCNSGDARRYQKLAKSTLVLIPMFGVYYLVFMILERIDNDDVFVVHMYMEMTTSSFQGAVIAMIFCFFNGEVQAEFSKRWYRHRIRRQSLISGRTTRALSTGSSYMARDRSSFSMVAIASTQAKAAVGEGVKGDGAVSVNRENGHDVTFLGDRGEGSNGDKTNVITGVDSYTPARTAERPSESGTSHSTSDARVASSSKVTFQEDSDKVFPGDSSCRSSSAPQTLRPNCVASSAAETTRRDPDLDLTVNGAGFPRTEDKDGEDETLNLIQSGRENTSHPGKVPSAKSTNSKLSLVRGEVRLDDANDRRDNYYSGSEPKGRNRVKDSKLKQFNSSLPSPDLETTDESAPILL